jgi:small subunit ribosomal protein S36
MTSLLDHERAPEAAPDHEATTTRGPPHLVVLATVAFAFLAGFWSVLTPLTEAPDEPAHLGLVLYLADTGDYPAYDELQHTAGLFQLCVDFATSANWCRTSEERAAGLVQRDRPADEAPAKHGRVHWDDPDFRALEPGRMNQMPQHPPLYYEVMAGALQVERAVVPGELSVDTELAFLRLMNVLLVLPLPWLAWCLARRLGARHEICLVASLTPLAIPQLTHIGATLNNDNLFVVLVSALMVLLVGVARGDRSRRTMVLVGMATGLALLTKGFAVVLPPVVVLAYLIGSASPEATVRGWLRRGWQAGWPTATALATALVVSGWWYFENLTTTDRLMPSIEDRLRLNPRNRPAGFEPRIGEYAASTATRLVEGFWGDFGWRRVELPTVISAAATLLCLGAVAVAFRQRSRTESADPPVTGALLTLMLAPIALLTAFVVIRSAVIYQEIGSLAFQQGRYLFAGVTAAAAVMAIGIHHLAGRRAVPVMVTGVFVMQGLAVAWCLTGWWGADDVGLPASLRAVVAWSGWPDPLVVALLAVTPVPMVLLARAARQYQSPM